MNFIKLSRIYFSGLYNNKFKTKIGFFNPSKTFNEIKTDYSRLNLKNPSGTPNYLYCSHNSSETERSLCRSSTFGFHLEISILDLVNYGITVPNDLLKLEVLHQSLAQIFNKWPDYRVCIYANGQRANQVEKSSKIIQRFPKSKAYQILFRRLFRRGGRVLLLSDNIFAKIPKIDMVIHYDLPVTLEVFSKRLAPSKGNLFMYGRRDNLFMAQLQNYLDRPVREWPMPSNQTILENFLNQIEEIIKNKPDESDGLSEVEDLKLSEELTKGGEHRSLPSVSDETKTNLKPENQRILASLLYMLHYKFKGLRRRQYLLYDPKFKVFKSRESVIKYLNENGVVYNSVSLSKKGFIIESLNELSISGSTPIVKYRRFNSHIKRAKRLIRRSYLSSPISRGKYFKKLVKEHERKIINKLKSV